MADNRFAIVFEKLAEAQVPSVEADYHADDATSASEELREIEELIRLTREISEPEGTLFTAT